MAERPEDLNLPNAVVTRIIKEALPGGVNVGKDARLAIGKAASVFVLYATSCANNNALKAKRKTIAVNDVFSALEDMEFDSFIEPLRTDLASHKKTQAVKKSKKSKAKEPATPTETESNDRDAETVEEVVEEVDNDREEETTAEQTEENEEMETSS